MKTSTSIWDTNNPSDSAVLRFSGIITRLFRCLIFVLISSCTQWPDSSERVLSISDERQEIPEYLTRDYLQELLVLMEHRTDQLVAVGAQECLPGQILNITRLHDLVKLEIDGNLFLDAEKNLKKAFLALNEARRNIEDSTISECLHSFRIGHRGKRSDPRTLVLYRELSDWENSDILNRLMGGRDVLDSPY